MKPQALTGQHELVGCGDVKLSAAFVTK